jgi:hypothetical protein
VLETTDVKQRQLKCLDLLHKKLEMFKKQKDVRMENMYVHASPKYLVQNFILLFSLVPCREQEAKLEAAQKKLYLERKKKAIEKELKLDVEDSDKLIEDFKKKLETLQVPEEAMHVINEEMVPLTPSPSSSSSSSSSPSVLSSHRHPLLFAEQTHFARAVVVGVQHHEDLPQLAHHPPVGPALQGTSRSQSLLLFARCSAGLAHLCV